MRTHRRGRSHPGRQDREQGQGQQAHPPRGRRCLSARPTSTRCGPACVARAGRGGVQRRGRLGVPGVDGPRHARRRARPSPSPRCRRRWPATSWTTAGPWPPSGACAGRRVATAELDDPAYVANDGLRCYHCKSALMDALGAAGRGAPGPPSCSGVNVDDLGDHRPGQPAAAERGAAFPLVEPASPRPTCGTGAAGSACAPGTSRRRPAWRRGCRTARRSRSACSAGSSGPRPRCAGSASPSCGCATTATWPASRCRSIGLDVVERRGAVVAAVRAAGYGYVTLDLEGLRSGNLNRALVLSRAGGRQT